MNRTCSVFRIVAAGVLTFGLTAANGAASAAEPRNSLNNYGALVPVDNAERTIVIQPDARYANVTNGETVKFVVRRADGSAPAFAWRFDLYPTQLTIDLGKIAPAGALDHDIRVYIAPDQRWKN